MLHRCLTLLLVMAFLPLGGGEPITIGERVRLRAESLREDRDLLISVPADYVRGRESYPVLYVLDGEDHFLQLRGTLDFLARNGLAPEVILVGIPNTNRTRDLTPTRGWARRMDGTWAEVPGAGGGDAFLDFVEKTVFPWVESRFRSVPFRILAGHSLGGLMALHAVAMRPGMFQGCIAASPALHWDRGYPVRVLEERLRDKAPLRCTLFATMANEEATAFYPSPARFTQLKSLLKRGGPEGFQGLSREFPQENHGTVVFESHYWGLRAIFDEWRLPKDPSLRSIRSHYDALSQRWGFPVAPREAWVNNAGYHHLETGDTREALQLFRYNLERHPDSANAQDSLGEGLERAGQLREALACYEQAVALATPLKSPLTPVFAAHAERVRRALVNP
ncbi:MAG TPA: alpha/beta hydrolase-fold protein [Holophagaceae bacterium]|nr:alpha/beta hydrolase-fold protein [Holophagaceae bacterium]